MRFGKCAKCESKHWLEGHHIHPKARFGKRGKLMYLCSNCHTEIHILINDIGRRSKPFYDRFHFYWLAGLISLVLIVGICIII